MNEASQWREYRNADSRVYWHNARTAESTWDKPDALRTPAERALASTHWKMYETAEGRKYYVHSTTNETTWDEPEEVRDALAQTASATPTMSVPGPPRIAASPFVGSSSLTSQTGALVGAGSIVPITAGTASSAPASNLEKSLDFGSTEEAIKAFMGLLRSIGVTPSWTWEQTMRQVVTDPLYKALRNLADRRSAFERYLEEYKRRERETRERNLERIRPAWREGLGRATEGEGGMKSWWSWERSRKALSEGLPEMWRMARDDDERRILWEEYVGELRRKEEQRDREIRLRNLEKVHSLLRDMQLDLYSTSWQSARKAIERSTDWQADADLRQVSSIDVLNAYEENVRDLERQVNDTRQRQKEERKRRARKAREAFVSLLHEMRLEGKIVAGSQWRDIHDTVEQDERYRRLLGKSGSSPLELFWDVVDELDRAMDANLSLIAPVLARKALSVTESTNFEIFAQALADEELLRSIDDKQRLATFQYLHAHAIRQAAELRKAAERKLRNQIDDLRYAMRKVEPAIEVTTSWDTALPLISSLPEYAALPDADSRKSAFDKYIRRLQEKSRTRDASETASRGGSPHSDRHSQRHDSSKPLSRDHPSEFGDDRHPGGRSRDRDSRRSSHTKRERDRDHREDVRREMKRTRRDEREEGEI